MFTLPGEEPRMNPLMSFGFAQALRLLSERSGEAPAPRQEKGSEDFEDLMKGLLSPDEANQVNEEELFAAIIFERLASHVSQEAAEKYQENFEKNKAALTRPDGYIFVEDAARKSLEQLVESDVISQEMGNQIHSEAFRAAQLDDNHDALWDSRGGPNDPTIAVEQLEAAIMSARLMLDKFDSGEKEAPLNTISAEYSNNPADYISKPETSSPEPVITGGSQSSNTEETSAAKKPASDNVVSGIGIENLIKPKATYVDGPEGFLFKPVSESNGNLVVLLPASMTHMIERVLLKDKDGKELESGSMSGIHNGGREHFRFNKAGADYPKNLSVEIRLKDGRSMQYQIPDPSQRYD